MTSEEANAPRTTDRAGGYEAWYVTVNDRAARTGFWIRYAIFNPAPGAGGEPHAALWACSFHRDHPSANFAGRSELPLAAFSFEADPFCVRIGNAVLDSAGCRGGFVCDAGEARWDLSWESFAKPFRFLTAPWQSLTSAANVGAQPALAVSGTIALGGSSHGLAGAGGGQQHTWGKTHALEWNWGFGGGIDDHASWFDGVSTRIGFAFGRVLRGSSLGLQLSGRRFALNTLPAALRHPGRVSPAGWELEASAGDLVAAVSVRPRPEDLVGVTYPDPLGGHRYCYHTEVADLELRLSERATGAVVDEVREEAIAAFEYASEHPLPGLPPRL